MKILQCFYYITHKDNLKSILKHGIWSRSKEAKNKSIFNAFGFNQKSISIYQETVVQIRRKNKLKVILYGIMPICIFHLGMSCFTQ